MSRIEIKGKRTFRIFAVISVLVLAQVAWWTTVFIRDVDVISELRIENSLLKSQLQVGQPDTAEDIKKTAFHRRLMFLSEGLFFSCMTCVALFLLYQAIRTEQRAEDTERNFIETLTHESKTPLTALKLRLESVAERWEKDRDLHQEVSLALEEVRRLISIVEKALSLSRIERKNLNFELISVGEVIQEILKRLDPFFLSKGVTISKQIDEEAMVRADYAGLQSTMQNLLENAVLYNDKSSKHISISVTRENMRVLIAIEDNGSGITKTERELVFHKFYRGRSSRRIPGTGLGLYLAQQVVEAHHGVLRLVDKVGGARFEIQLPVVTA